MNPGLVVKLRPAGPWRIGPDSGARNRVDFIYHSDSLYSAVTSAMARLGSLDEWLDATARKPEGAFAPAVCFSSCFPFLDEIGFVVPPRTIWPPTSPSLMSARVRWKSARFVPLGIVQAILAGQRLDENHWSVDGASECLVPAGRPGPFRSGVRWSAAVDRLTGSSERHSTACLEFRPGAGLWTIVSFVDQAAQARWLEPIKAAFRLLADTGFGGERSRGWGRAESPEFIDGTLPDMILPPPPPPEQVPESPVLVGEPEHPATGVPDLPGEHEAEPVSASPVPELPIEAATELVSVPPAPVPTEGAAEPVEELEPVTQQYAVEPVDQAAAESPDEPAPPIEDPQPKPPGTEPPVDEPPATEPRVEDPQPEPPVTEPPVTDPPIEGPPADPSEPGEARAALRAPSELAPLAADTSPVPPEPEPALVPEPEPAPPTSEPAAEPAPPVAELPPPEPEPPAPEPVSAQPPTPDFAPAPGPRPLAPASHSVRIDSMGTA